MLRKRIFPDFPFGYEESPPDSELVALCDDFGGWKIVLNPQAEPPIEFLEELERHNYSKDELLLWQKLATATGREKVLLNLACYGFMIANSSNELSRQIYEGFFFNLADEQKRHGITRDEIIDASAKFAPFMSN